MDLDWNDQTDFDSATRGRIASLEPCVITNHRGRVVWDGEQWGFLDGAGPTGTVHPSLWRVSRLAHAQENGTWRNIYLTGAQELRSPSAPAPRPLRKIDNPDVLRALSTGQLFDAIAVRLDGPRAARHRLLLRWEFTDTGEVWTVLVGNGVLTPMRGDAPEGEKPQLTLRISRAGFVAVLAGITTFQTAAADGVLRTAGDVTALATLTDLLEEPDRNFAIVQP